MPFVWWQMRELQRFGISRFVILAGHLSDALRDALNAAEGALPRAAEFVVSVEPRRAGTGGALTHAANLLDERFLLLNGDSLFDANLARLLRDAALDPPETACRMLLRSIPDTSRYGTASLDGDRVTEFSERRSGATPGFINAGVYAMRRRCVQGLPEVCSLEAEVIPGWVEAGLVRGTTAEGWFIDIGIPADLEKAQAVLPGRLRRPAVILSLEAIMLDQEGPQRLAGDACAAIAAAVERGWHVFVAVAQAALLEASWAVDQVRAAGGTIDGWCEMEGKSLRSLLHAWQADVTRSLVVARRHADLQVAATAGVRAALFHGGGLGAFLAEGCEWR
jgi:D-glycero-D-manno-heptose 1,7-bisphosphate phosphatase